jgi:hypothetical protein
VPGPGTPQVAHIVRLFAPARRMRDDSAQSRSTRGVIRAIFYKDLAAM